ncbi:unnamed protein product [Heligmosomoides polygyrus]|uniref:EF-hand domain-containing protein n=1 Tax=Heligmosomoides polygyrus TaxID=6339 RepID=A0A183GVN4_HELPZ|nr:unnamed protein product [Heligmosomoides polygyrus]
MFLVLGSPGSTDGSSYCSEDVRKSTKDRKKSRLVEVFPSRYQFANTYLFLDKMVYIYLQFIDIRNSKRITDSGLRRFLHECGIAIHFEEDMIECHIGELSNRFTGDPTNTKGLPFHGFFLLMVFIAESLYPKQPNLRAQLASLLLKCEGSLRNKGVRSKRLRREEVHLASPRRTEIFMLPDRVRRTRARARSCEPINVVIHTVSKAVGEKNTDQTSSLPKRK